MVLDIAVNEKSVGSDKWAEWSTVTTGVAVCCFARTHRLTSSVLVSWGGTVTLKLWVSLLLRLRIGNRVVVLCNVE